MALLEQNSRMVYWSGPPLALKQILLQTSKNEWGTQKKGFAKVTKGRSPNLLRLYV